MRTLAIVKEQTIILRFHKSNFVEKIKLNNPILHSDLYVLLFCSVISFILTQSTKFVVLFLKYTYLPKKLSCTGYSEL